MRYLLTCTRCSSKYPKSYNSQLCRCGGILEVRYKKVKLPEKGEEFWDFEGALPDGKYLKYELGGTKLIEAMGKGLYLKLETGNPTRSFKDRGSAIEVAKAAEYGYREVVCASTGNMAYSIAYYARLYNLHAKVFISKGANRDKLANILSTHRAELMIVNGDFTKAQALAELYAEKHAAFLTGDYCYRKEGQKTVCHEILAKLPEVKNIIVPVGNATLISGVFKALAEAKTAGRIKSLPSIIGVQSTRCMPLVRAFRRGKGIKYEKPATKADAIAVGYPTFGEQAIDARSKTKGTMVSVSDSEMAAEQLRFLEDYGLVAELAGVASLAAFKKSKPKGITVAIISGGNV